MANKKRHNKKIYIIGILLIVVIFAINRFSHPKQEDKNLEEQNRTEEEIRDLENENRIAQLQGLEERDRMETYFGMFLQYVENKEYETAYNLLYEEFKKTYFPTLETFIEYAQKNFPEMVIEYENIERNGEVYVLWVNMADVLNSSRNDEKQKMNVVIKENDYNDFVMSFSVIQNS